MPLERREKWKRKMLKAGRCERHGRPRVKKPGGGLARGCILCLVYDRDRKRDKLGLKRRFKKCLSYAKE